MSHADWLKAIENVGERFKKHEITGDEAIAEFGQLGLDAASAENYVAVASSIPDSPFAPAPQAYGRSKTEQLSRLQMMALFQADFYEQQMFGVRGSIDEVLDDMRRACVFNVVGISMGWNDRAGERTRLVEKRRRETPKLGISMCCWEEALRELIVELRASVPVPVVTIQPGTVAGDDVGDAGKRSASSPVLARAGAA